MHTARELCKGCQWPRVMLAYMANQHYSVMSCKASLVQTAEFISDVTAKLSIGRRADMQRIRADAESQIQTSRTR